MRLTSKTINVNSWKVALLLGLFLLGGYYLGKFQGGNEAELACNTFIVEEYINGTACLDQCTLIQKAHNKNNNNFDGWLSGNY